MNYKKGLILITKIGAVAAPIVPVISCGKKEVEYDPTKQDSVIMIVGQAGHDDKGFLQGGYDGSQKAVKDISKLKIYGEMKISNSSIPVAKEGTNNALQAGAYVILGVGFQYPTFFNTKDFAEKYKDREFIALDGQISGILNSNVTSVAFKAEQAAFLGGVATGLFLAKNYDTYKSNGGLIAGAFGGGKYPTVKDMITGFIHGLAYYNDNLAKTPGYKVKFAGWNGEDNGFTGGFVPNATSTTKSKTLLSKHVDVVFPVAGGQVSSMVDAIKAMKSKTKIIGVDSDQNKVFGADGDMFVTSALKNTKTAAYEALKAIYKVEGAKIKKGENNVVGLTGRFVGLAKGVLGSDDFKGTALQEIIKGSKINTASTKTVFEQLTSSANDIYTYASTLTSTDWEKAKVIFGFNGQKTPQITDFIN